MLLKDEQLWVDGVAEKIRTKMAWVSEKSRNKIPYTTINGVHDDRLDKNLNCAKDNGLFWWTNGVWGGMMWLMYHETGIERYAEIARISEQKLDQCLEGFTELHHDVGFMWLPTAVADYRLTGNTDARRRGLHAAAILAGRFNHAGRFIRAWNHSDMALDEGGDVRGWAIVDCMMNIPLLYWAGEITDNPHYRQIAMMYADTVMEHFVRPDGSVNHIVGFNPETGEKVQAYGGQGYNADSSWTRGQTWGIYGFMISYIHIGKQQYLDTAKKIAHYFIANIPESGLIPVDFRQPAEPAWEDSTAAAIAACGLIEIARHVDTREAGMYLKTAIRLLQVLDEKRCCWGTENDCILEKCTAAYHRQEHESNIIYGDYFFMEAIFKLKGNDVLLW